MCHQLVKTWGYGTVSADGKTFTKAAGDGWNTADWAEVASPDLTKAGYTAPDKANVAHVQVNSSTKDQNVDVYYGHQTELVTPQDPKNPNTPVNPNDPRQTPSTYPGGLTANDLQQTVVRHINYVGVNSDGTKTAVNGAPDGKTSYDQSVTFERQAVIDKVTGELLGYDTNANDKKPTVTTTDADRAWMPATATFDSVRSQTPASVVDKDGKAFDLVDISSVDSMTVNPGQVVKDVTVTYSHTPEVKQGSVTVVFHDDTTNSTIPNVGTKTGTQETGTPVNYTPNSDLTTLENEGYVYVGQDGNIPSEVPDGNKTITIHVKHGEVPVNPETPGKPDQPLNPNDPRPKEDQPKYPAGSDVVTKDITRTIHYEGADQYTPDDASQTVHFEAKGVLDKVTGEWTTPLAWSADQNFDAKRTPNIPGYHVVSVDRDTTDNKNVNGATVNHADSNYTVTVKYAKDETPVKQGSVNVVFHDDTDNVTIPNVGLNTGDLETGTAVTYTPNSDLTTLENEGYVYVGQDGNIPSEVPDGNRTITIHVKHGEVPVNPETPGKPDQPLNPNDPRPKEDQPKYPAGSDVVTKSVTRTIHYSGAGEYTPDDASQTVNFTAKGVLDKVTGEWKTPLAWSENQSFDAKRTPNIPGYHVVSVDRDTTDNKNVNGATVDHNASDYTVNVVYAPDVVDQHLTVKFYDDTDKKALSSYDKAVDGPAGTDLNYTTQASITELENKGYELVSDSFTAANLDGKMPANGGNYEVHLVHKTTTVTPKDPGKPGEPVDPNNPTGPKYPNGTAIDNLQKQGKMTVTYVIDGNDANKPTAPETQTRDITFTKEITFDQVTGEILKDSGWNVDSQTYPIINSPAVEGYTPNKNYVGGKTVNVTDTNLNVDYEVHYTKNAEPVDNTQKAKVVYQDVNNPDKVIELATDDSANINGLSGQPGDQINYSTTDRIKEFEAKGYVLKNNGFPVGAAFDNDNASDQIFYVTFVHGTTPVNPDNPGPNYTKDELQKTITRTIHYVGADKNPADVHQTVSFTANGVRDTVTNEMVEPLTWSADQTFNNQITPTVSGYHVESVDRDSTDNTNVNSAPISHTGSDYTVTVKYAKDAEPVKQGSLTVVFHDDTTGQDIPGYGTTISSQKVGTTVEYKSQGDLTKLENKGYVYVPTDGDTVPTEIAEGDKTITIHVKHGTRPVTPENPADPNQPVDPTKPGTPTPVDQHLGKTDLQKTITRDVTYVYTDGQKSAQPVHQEVSFKGEGTIDLVTGNLVNLNDDGSIKDQRGSITWNETSQNLADIPAIDTTGYEITGVNSENSFANVDRQTGAISSQSVTPQSGNISIQITLTPKATPVETTRGSITYIDTTTGKTLETANFGGPVGDAIDYKTGDRIKFYEGLGYKLVSNNFNDGSQTFNQDASKNVFEVKLAHDTVPVDPEHPGYGYDEASLQKTITRDVTYVYADGTQADTPVHQEVSFHREGIVDKVTHQFVTVSEENGTVTLTPVAGPNWVVDGSDSYGATKSIDLTTNHIVNVAEVNTNAAVDRTNGSVAAETVTPTNQNSKIVITLDKNVVNDQNAMVVYRDVDNHNAVIAQSDNLTGKPGDKINYSTENTLTDLTNKGYVLVTNGFDGNGEQPSFDNDDKKSQIFYVDLKHGTRPVTPTDPVDPQHPVDPDHPDNPANKDPQPGLTATDLQKTVNRDFTYNFTDGTSHPEVQEATQTVTFTGTAHIDKVTGQLVTVDRQGNVTGKGQVSWDKTSDNLASVAAKNVPGYHVVSTQNANINGSVDNLTVNPNSGDVHVVITYAPDVPAAETVFGKQTVHYVDQNGHKLMDDSINSTFTFTKNSETGNKWNADEHKYADATAPAIPGYEADNQVYEGQIGKPSDPNKEITITYHVVQNDQNAMVVYRDVDNHNVVIAQSDNLTGKPGDKINYSTAQTLTDLENQGYELVTNGFDGNGAQPTFDDDDKKSQTFYVDLKHKTVPVTPENPNGYDKTDLQKTVTRTVEYQYANGNPAHETVTQTVNFSGKGTLDKVTGNLVNLNDDGSIKDQYGKITWDSDSKDLNAIPAVTIPGYYVSNVRGQNTSATINSTTAEIGGETVTPDSKNGIITIVYTKSPEVPVSASGSLTYIDDTTGAHIGSASFSGNVGDLINYTTASTIQNFVAQGYKLVSNDFNDGTQVYDKDSAKNTFEVHLVHDTTPVNPENPGYGYDKTDLEKTVTRDVTYVYADGSQAAAPVHQEASFRGEGTIDKVTHQLVTVKDGKITGAGEITWTATGDNFAATDSIDTTKYHITKISVNGTNATVNQDTGVVSGETVTPNSNNSKIVITLANNPINDQTAMVVYRDVDNHNAVITQSGTLTGQPGSDINYSTANQLKALEEQGYVLVSNGFDGNGMKQTFDNDDSKSQIFYVDLKHGTKDITPNTPDPDHGFTKESLTKTGTQTVIYTGAGEKTPKDNVTNITFEHTLTIDKVTGKVTKDNGWTPASQSYTKIETPTVDGYTADKSVAGGETVTINPTTGNGEINKTYVVNYTKNPETPAVNNQNAQVRYIDQDNNNSLITASNNLSGKPGSAIDYSTANTITELENQGYELVYDGFTGKNATFDNDDSTTQTFDVVLKHKHTTITPNNPGKPGEPINPNYPDGPKWESGTDKDSLTKVGTQTVHYVGAGDKTPADKTNTVEFNHSITYDNVTGNVVEDNGWTPSSKTYHVVDTPVIDGYTADKVYVGGDTVNVTDGNIDRNYTVTYTPTPVTPATVQGQITYIDDTTGENLSTNVFSGKVGDQINYTTAEKIKNYESQGYVFVSNNFKDGNETFAQSGNVFEVHLKHGSQDITPNNPDPDHGFTKESLTKTGTQTIVYTGAGENTPNNNVTNVTFEHTLTIDTVTGKVTKDNGWQINGDNYKAVNTPTVDGYTPDQLTAGGVEVTLNPNTGEGDLNKVYTVTYTKNETPVTPVTPAKEQGNITVTVHDVTTGQDLPQYGKTSGSQDEGTSFSYDKTGTITELTNKGYKVINPDVTIPSEITKGSQNVIIYVEHNTTTITPNDPGKPGEPINPNDPTGPKWPTGTDQNSLTKVGTQTIHYVGAGDNTPQDSVTTVEFGHTITYDNVTGEVVTDNGWTPSSQTYTTVGTPTVDGYTPDKYFAGGDTVNVTDNDIDRTITVTYTKNETPETPVTPVTPAVVQGQVTYIDDTTGETLSTDSFSGKVGDQITYTTAGKIGTYEGQGYELVSNNFSDGNETFAQDGNSFTVHLKHTTTTVTPNNPDPKHGYTKDSLTKTGTQTVIYNGAGNQTPDKNVTTIEFGHSLVIDNVTGEVVEDNGWTPSSQTYTTITTPTVDGYDADQPSVGGETVTIDHDGNGDINKTYVVNYTKHETPVTPVTPVQADQTAKVQYIDLDSNNAVITESGQLTGKAGDVINYSTADEIANLINQGYVLENDGFPAGAAFDNIDGNEQIFTVSFHHGHTPVNPNNPGKPGEPINPNYPDGPKFPQGSDQVTKDVTRTITYVDNNGNQLHEPVEQTAHFTGEGVIDKVTGQWITPIDWSGDGNLAGQKTPTVAGYHVTNISRDGDGENITGVTVTNDDSDYTVTVTYTRDVPVNPSTPVLPVTPQGGDDETVKNETKTTTFTVHYVGAGNNNPGDNVQTVEWHRTVTVDDDGTVTSATPWTTDDGYNNVNTPVVEGYHADRAAVDAPQLTPDGNSEATVTYAPNGHIIPVDRNNNPIPGAEQPVYTTDPSDPTKVLGDEPVPTIPSYTPEQETVTPANPGIDTPVIYDQSTTPVTPVTPEQPSTPTDDGDKTPEEPATTPSDNGEEATPETPAPPTGEDEAAPQSQETVTPSVKNTAAQPAAKQEAKTLPQTGNEDTNVAEVMGLAALGLTGLLAAGKKRRKEEE